MLDRGKWTGLQTEKVEGGFKHPVVVAMKVWAATGGLQLRLCCDSLKNCPIVTSRNEPKIEWQAKAFLCPKGTNKVVVVVVTYVCERLHTI